METYKIIVTLTLMGLCVLVLLLSKRRAVIKAKNAQESELEEDYSELAEHILGEDFFCIMKSDGTCINSIALGYAESKLAQPAQRNIDQSAKLLIQGE